MRDDVVIESSASNNDNTSSAANHPARRRATCSARAHALHFVWRRQVGVIEQRGREIGIGYEVFAKASGCKFARIAHQKRHFQRFFVDETFVIPAVIAQKKALIAGVNHNRIVLQTAGFQPIQ